MRRKILVIRNPAAGRGKRHRLDRTLAALANRGCEAIVRDTSAPAHAERLAREAVAEFDCVVAAGGDGTASEIANGLYGSDVPMAVLPLGTGNVLANEIGMPRRPSALAAAIADAPARPIWPGRIGGRLFLTMVGVGFDAEVLAALDQRSKRRLGKFAFIGPILSVWLRDRVRQFTVQNEGAEFRVASAVVANGRFYAGSFLLAPDARLADPSFRVVLFHRSGRIAALRGLAALAFGSVGRLTEVTVISATNLFVDGAEPSFVQVDGEIGAALPLTLAIAEEPLLVLWPGAAEPSECS